MSAGDVLLYDGDCGFCGSCLRLFHRLARRPVRALPSSHYPLNADDRARSQREILFVTGDGRVLGGVAALAAALQSAGRPGLGWLLRHTPFAAAIYRAVARHRTALTCRVVRPESPSPPRGPEPPDPVRN